MALGVDHARREGLRARLKAVRLSCPLFDTDTWVRTPPGLWHIQLLLTTACVSCLPLQHDASRS